MLRRHYIICGMCKASRVQTGRMCTVRELSSVGSRRRGVRSPVCTLVEHGSFACPCSTATLAHAGYLVRAAWDLRTMTGAGRPFLEPVHERTGAE